MDILAKITELDVTGSNGEIPGGFLYASVKNIGAEDVIVNAVAISPGEAKSYPFVGKGYEAISYEVSAQGTLRIMYVI